jgi:hypothetical protein
VTGGRREREREAELFMARGARVQVQPINAESATADPNRTTMHAAAQLFRFALTHPLPLFSSASFWKGSVHALAICYVRPRAGSFRQPILTEPVTCRVPCATPRSQLPLMPLRWAGCCGRNQTKTLAGHGNIRTASTRARVSELAAQLTSA